MSIERPSAGDRGPDGVPGLDKKVLAVVGLGEWYGGGGDGRLDSIPVASTVSRVGPPELSLKGMYEPPTGPELAHCCGW